MVIISLELTRVNPDRNIFSINVELTSTFLQRFGQSPSPNFKFNIYCSVSSGTVKEANFPTECWFLTLQAHHIGIFVCYYSLARSFFSNKQPNPNSKIVFAKNQSYLSSVLEDT